MAKSFSEILSAAPQEIEPSRPLPAGEYELQVVKADIEELKYDFGDHKEGDEYLAVYFKPVAPVEVDEEELEACEDWRSKLLSLRIFPEQMGDRFVDVQSERGLVYDCGLDPSDYSTIEEMVQALPGSRCLGTVTHSPNKNNPAQPYVNLRQTAPLD